MENKDNTKTVKDELKSEDAKSKVGYKPENSSIKDPVTGVKPAVSPTAQAPEKPASNSSGVKPSSLDSSSSLAKSNDNSNSYAPSRLGAGMGVNKPKELPKPIDPSKLGSGSSVPKTKDGVSLPGANSSAPASTPTKSYVDPTSITKEESYKKPEETKPITNHLVNSKPIDKKLGDSSTLSKTSDTEVKGSDVKGAEMKKSEVKGSDVKGTEPKGADVKGTEVKKSEVKGAEIKGTEIKGTEVKESVTKGAEVTDSLQKKSNIDISKTTETDKGNSLETKSVDNKKTDTTPVDAKSETSDTAGKSSEFEVVASRQKKDQVRQMTEPLKPVSRWAFWKRASQRDEQLTRIAEGYVELVDMVRSIRDQANAQYENNMIMRESLKHLPSAIKGLEGFGKSQEQVGQVLEKIHQQMKNSTSNEEQMTKAMYGLNDTMKGVGDASKASTQTFDRVQERMRDSDIRMENLFNNVRSSEEKVSQTMMRLQRNMSLIQGFFLLCLLCVIGGLIYIIINKSELKDQLSAPNTIEVVEPKGGVSVAPAPAPTSDEELKPDLEDMPSSDL